MLALSLIWIFAVPSAELFSVSLHPRRAMWRVGDRQVLRCSALDCTEGALFSWTLLEDKPSYNIPVTNQSESVLIFDPVVPAHENSFLCKVRCGGEGKRHEKELRSTISVYSPPKAPVISGNSELRDGETQSVLCEVPDAYPLEYIHIIWHLGDAIFNGESEDRDGKSQITFMPSAEDNGKMIRCGARLMLEGVPEDQTYQETTETLNVLYAPRDIKSLETAVVEAGGSINLTCKADGNPKPEILWRIVGEDGQAVMEWRSESLSLHSVTPSHAGDYECVARNVIGYSTKRVGVVVQAFPRNTSIKVSPDGDLKEGDNVTISCQSDAVPVDRVILFRLSEGQRTELQSTSGSSAFVTLSSVRLADAGFYECEASNQYGSQTTNATLNIMVFPLEVQLSPGDGAIPLEKGSSLTLSCTATGCPNPRFFWKSTLDGPVHSRTEVQGLLSKLFLGPNDLVDDEAYTCEVHCGSVRAEKTTEIKVFSFPNDPIVEALGPFVEGKRTTLSCVVHGVSPVSLLRIQWLHRNGSILLDDTSFLSSGDNTESIMAFMPEADDHGEMITCRAMLDIKAVPRNQSQRSASILVNLLSPPKNTFIDVSPAGDLKEGYNVTVTCTSHTEPGGRLVLHRVFEGQRTEVKSGLSPLNFTLPSIKLADSGLFECEASNEYGRHSTSMDVIVKAPPRNTTVQAFPSLKVQEGQNITICCQTVSFPPSAVTLKKLDGTMELYSPNGTFFLLNLTTDDTGLYQVNVTNDLGYDTEIFTISVMEKRSDPSPRWEEFILPAVGLVTIVTTASLIIHYLRKARMKGSYELAKSEPGTA